MLKHVCQNEKRKISECYGNGTTEQEQHGDVNSFYRHTYSVTLLRRMLSMNYIKDRYEQMDYIESYKKLENLILYSVNVEKHS